MYVWFIHHSGKKAAPPEQKFQLQSLQKHCNHYRKRKMINASSKRETQFLPMMHLSGEIQVLSHQKKKLDKPPATLHPLPMMKY